MAAAPTPFIANPYAEIALQLLGGGDLSHFTSKQFSDEALAEGTRAVEQIMAELDTGALQTLVEAYERGAQRFPDSHHELTYGFLQHIGDNDVFGPAHVAVQRAGAQLDRVEKIFISLVNGWYATSGWEMPHGVWDHFKGGVYLSDSVERDADTGEPRVRYLSLLFGPPWHSRRAAQWRELVEWPDGMWRSRFVYRGPDLRRPPPAFKVASPSHASV